jgi:hypothetical protein
MLSEAASSKKNDERLCDARLKRDATTIVQAPV